MPLSGTWGNAIQTVIFLGETEVAIGRTRTSAALTETVLGTKSTLRRRWGQKQKQQLGWNEISDRLLG